MMKKFLALTFIAATIASCDSENYCTNELRMIQLQVRTAGMQPVTLDSSYTIRSTGGERINYPSTAPGYYTVLDDSYHPKLKSSRDNFTFHGFKNGAKVVEEVYQISADKCHITKVSGKDSVVLQ